MGSSTKKRFLAKLIKDRNPDVIMIQESKIEKIEASAIHRFWGNSNVEFAEARAVGTSGGLITMWNKDSFQLYSVLASRHFIIATGCLKELVCTLVNIYAPNEERGRRELWEEILSIKTASNIPWCMGEILMR